MKLTSKQENFCLAFIELGNASDAYRAAYEAEKMKDETIWRSAHDVLKNPKVSARIDELRAPVAERVRITLESHLDEMQRLKDLALQKDNINAALTAEMGRAKAAGLYVTKVESKTEISGPEGEPIKFAIDEAISNLAMRIRSKEL
jgi:phage terminase small subunit